MKLLVGEIGFSTLKVEKVFLKNTVATFKDTGSLRADKASFRRCLNSTLGYFIRIQTEQFRGQNQQQAFLHVNTNCTYFRGAFEDVRRSLAVLCSQRKQ